MLVLGIFCDASGALGALHGYSGGVDVSGGGIKNKVRGSV
jgi:hypothetical protein